MTTMVRRLVLVAMVVAAASTAPAGAAAPPSSCGGEWTEAASCSFTYEGEGLGLGGRVIGTAPVLVAVTIEGPPLVAGGPNTVLLGCASASTDWGACGAVSTGPWIEVAPGTVLTCKVQGTPGGTYGCDGSVFPEE